MKAYSFKNHTNPYGHSHSIGKPSKDSISCEIFSTMKALLKYWLTSSKNCRWTRSQQGQQDQKKKETNKPERVVIMYLIASAIFRSVIAIYSFLLLCFQHLEQIQQRPMRVYCTVPIITTTENGMNLIKRIIIFMTMMRTITTMWVNT